MKKILLLLNIFFLSSCYNQERIVDKNKLMGNDIRLYQNTQAWNLAKAVDAEDILKIKEEVTNRNVNVDYKDPRFGSTLLTIAIENSKYESVKTLLDNGANPNIGDSYRGTTPIIQAAANDDPKYLALLLNFKGNPNSFETAPIKDGDKVRNTALIAAISYMDKNSLDKVEMLVDAGADVNFDNNGKTNKPLTHAIMMDKMDVALYLLEKGANYKDTMYTMINGHKVSILEALRKNLFDLNSEKYQQKLKVIDFLKSKGLDYSKEPIPQETLDEIKNKYGDNWKNYIDNY